MAHHKIFKQSSLAIGIVLALTTAAITQFQQENLQTFVLTEPGGSVRVYYPVDIAPAFEPELRAYVQMATHAVTAYIGRFPVTQVDIRARIFHGSGIRRGRTFSKGPDPNSTACVILISIGDQTSHQDLMDDWILTHEMLHLAFPNMSEDKHWAEEGLSTYAEPIARLRVGNLQPERIWGDMVRDMHKGEPSKSDNGLDHTHTHDRTYWGGALFYMMADVEIRKHSNNKKGLEDALRGILAKGGNISQDWSIENTFETGDKATHTHVLMDLYKKMKDEPSTVDLATLWAQLGIMEENGTIRFNDKAPLAKVRKSIETGQRVR
jgi:hypothetical protein